MKHIKDKYIDIVKSRVDICQLVVDLCPGTVLKPSGPHRKKCCCVFHQEETPSLMLDTTMNRYKCYGCGKSGDVISFVEECQGVGFIDAIRCLLDMYCPDVDTHDLFDQSTTPEQEERDRKAETMYIYNQYAQEFFEHSTKQTMMKQLRVVDTPKKRMAQHVDGGIRISAEHSVLATVQQEGTNFFNMQRIRD